MEGGLGPNSVPRNSIDKSTVLDVKPLRTLVPVFPSTPQAPPTVCAPPSGPFPSGFTPFYPFSGPQGFKSPEPNSAQTPQGPMPAPLRSFRTPTAAVPINYSGAANGDTVDSQLGASNSARKKARKAHKKALSVYAGKSSSSTYVVSISASLKENGDRETVLDALMTYDALRRRIAQLEDSNEGPFGGLIKRAHLKAGNILLTKGYRTNTKKRVGIVPGVEIGDIYFFRMELCVVGLHAHSMGGIDYMVVKGDSQEEPVALAIVSAGGYDDEAEDTDVLIYTGQGGVANKKDNKLAADQKLERGNLALERSLHRANEVRVIRGVKDSVNPLNKVYVYDGLYTIRESWMEKGKSGCNIFKYKLVRVPGQPSAFSVWKSIQMWRDGFSSREGQILPDLTSGGEKIPVSLVNDVDGDKGPDYFTYCPVLKYTKSSSLITDHSLVCNCNKACQPGNLSCSCIQKNGGDFPYTTNGVLVSRKPMIYECGPSCLCFPNCKNRVSQTGLKAHLEVFKTNDRGWGLRSWDPIRAGTFICEYAGEVVDKARASKNEINEYTFDTTRTYYPFKWNYEPGLLDEENSGDTIEDYDIPSPLIINAKNVGNVARFMNHNCSPNVFWQPVIYEQNNESFLHIAFFAMRNIPPMTELTYDYGITPAEAEGNSAVYERQKCLCGSSKCRGYFG